MRGLGIGLVCLILLGLFYMGAVFQDIDERFSEQGQCSEETLDIIKDEAVETEFNVDTGGFEESSVLDRCLCQEDISQERTVILWKEEPGQTDGRRISYGKLTVHSDNRNVSTYDIESSENTIYDNLDSCSFSETYENVRIN